MTSSPGDSSLPGSRPAYHFTAPVNWLNDPNGLVFVAGEYHLFYQHHPHDNTFGPPHWGHASSSDLLAWRDHPIALEPDDLGLIFSGSAVIDHDNTAGFGPGTIVAAFTHHLEDGIERQSLAYSRDAGSSWSKYSGNPILHAPEGVPDFRDPRLLWWEGPEGSHWVMLLAVGVAVWIYTSDNLIEWSFASAFEPDPQSARTWECPDLFQLPVAGTAEHRWVMSVGVDTGDLPHLYGTRYFVGDFDGERFTESHTAVHWADHGADFYAAQTWSASPDDRTIWIGWMNNWAYARQTPTDGWRGAMSVPRELGLVETLSGVRLTQRPVKELEQWQQPLLHEREVSINSSGNPLAGLRGTALDVTALIDVDRSSARALRFAVRLGTDEATEIVLDLHESTLSVDRFHAGRHLIHRHYEGTRLAAVAVDGLLDLRVLVDATSVEVFAGNGVVAITEQIFPDLESDTLSLLAVDGTVLVDDLQVHAIAPTSATTPRGTRA